MVKEIHFTEGIRKGHLEPESFENDEEGFVSQNDNFNKWKEVEEVADESVNIEGSIDNKKVKKSKNEYRGPKADEYVELTDEEIAARYPDYNKDSSDLELKTQKIKSEIHHAMGDETFRQKESMNQHYKDKTYSDVPFQTRDKENQSGRGGYAGKDNLKTMPEGKKQRKFRDRIKSFFTSQKEELE